MKKYFKIGLVLTSCIVLISFSLPKKKLKIFDAPPGTIKLSDNFYVDETEVRNLDYREFIYWTDRVFGDSSKKYLSILPNNNVWSQDSLCLYSHTYQYFTHPAYDNYPLVGITQEQANAYTKWRSDRVFEMFLIMYKIIDINYEVDSTNYFTIERYFNSEYLDYIPDTNFLYYPNYRLPTQTEFETIVQYSDSIDRIAKSFSYPIYTYQFDCDTIEYKDMPNATIYTSYCSNKKNPIFNIRGNVSEWLAEENISGGGGWHHSKDSIAQNLYFVNDKENAWTGFRNVCEWKKWELD